MTNSNILAVGYISQYAAFPESEYDLNIDCRRVRWSGEYLIESNFARVWSYVHKCDGKSRALSRGTTYTNVVIK